MESVAPPGGVMLSASTTRLVEGVAVLGEPELVRIKGSDEPVAARRLLGVSDRDQLASGTESALVGRRWEMAAVQGLLERAVDGQGGVVTVVGPPGIGKSRLVREVTVLAAARGVEVFSTYCESHAADVPFRVAARLLRAAIGAGGLDGPAARAQARARFPDADPEDVLLVEDLLGIADPDVELPKIDPDARRRRLTALVNAASLARDSPAVYVIEDAHWIDEVSESMLADFLTVIPQSSALVVITYRPEYTGALSRVGGAPSIALAPLNDPETTALLSELLGPDPSITGLVGTISEKAGGNPFFVEELVRDLAERGVLADRRGAHTSTADAAVVGVPASLQAAIAARIDRLDPAAKRTLGAAAVIGTRFSGGLLENLGVEPDLTDLVHGEFIDQTSFTGDPEYVFHHPLIRTVAYESQLKADRADLHRRVAAAIEMRGSVDQDAALIAEHLEAGGDLHDAYNWHMRAATWATNRDINAARLSWERAQQISDALTPDHPNRTAMSIAPRTMLCGIAWRTHASVAGHRFEELRELCAVAGDTASLAIAMAGLVADHAYRGRIREASRLASEAWALTESVDDPALTVGLSSLLMYAKYESAEFPDMLRWSQRVIDLAAGDPSKSNMFIGSPLALALATRAISRYFLGYPGWRDDLQQGLYMARDSDPLTYAGAMTYVVAAGIPFGVLRSDDSVVREIEDAVRIAERAGDDFALSHIGVTLGLALVHRSTAAERDRGEKLLAEVGDVFLREEHHLGDLPMVTAYAARERARNGERDSAIPLMRAALDDVIREGQLLGYGITATGVLVETLLDRGTPADIAEAEAAVRRLAAVPAPDGAAMRDVWLLRMHALLARAHGDDVAYRDYRDRYRDMAENLGFEGHIAWAEEMP